MFCNSCCFVFGTSVFFSFFANSPLFSKVQAEIFHHLKVARLTCLWWTAELPKKDQRLGNATKPPLCGVSSESKSTKAVFIDEPHCYSRRHWRPFTDQILWAALSPLHCQRKPCCCWVAAFAFADSECFPETVWKVLRAAHLSPQYEIKLADGVFLPCDEQNPNMRRERIVLGLSRAKGAGSFEVLYIYGSPSLTDSASNWAHGMQQAWSEWVGGHLTEPWQGDPHVSPLHCSVVLEQI